MDALGWATGRSLKDEFPWGYDDIIALKDHSPVGLTGKKVGFIGKDSTFAGSEGKQV